jgi:hypothetical protein
VPVGIGAKHDAADRANQERQAEGTEGQQQRRGRIVVREERLGNIDREIAVDGDVIPFQRVADRGCNDQPGDVLFLRSRFCHFGQLGRRRYGHSISLR